MSATDVIERMRPMPSGEKHLPAKHTTFPTTRSARIAPSLKWALSIIFLLVCYSCPDGFAATRIVLGGDTSATELQRWIKERFAKWDRNSDGSLDAKELKSCIEDRSVRGGEAAALVVIKNHGRNNRDSARTANQTQAAVMRLGEDPLAAREYRSALARIEQANASLFLPQDPNLFTFRQGGAGDCYFLSVIGAMVQRNPTSLKTMFVRLPGNAYEVRFAGGKVAQVAMPTDAELALGAQPGRDRGLWLMVLEKAYAQVRTSRPGRSSLAYQASSDRATDEVLSGGRPGPVIQDLTGHRATTVSLGKWLEQTNAESTKLLHQEFLQISNGRRLAALSTPRDVGRTLPKGIDHSHAFGVLAYDPVRRRIKLFNPWGNEFVPAVPHGLVNGYPTRHGVFEVPLGDVPRIFATISYETVREIPSNP